MSYQRINLPRLTSQSPADIVRDMNNLLMRIESVLNSGNNELNVGNLISKGTTIRHVGWGGFAGVGYRGSFSNQETNFEGKAARGTEDAPSALQINDAIVQFVGYGYGATSWSSYRGAISITCTENWTDAAQGTKMWFNVTPNGTITPGAALTLNNDKVVDIYNTLRQAAGTYKQKDGSYYGILDFTSSTALAADKTLTIDLANANRTLKFLDVVYTPTNVTTDRSYDANSTSIDEIADVLGTLIADLQSVGIIK